VPAAAVPAVSAPAVSAPGTGRASRRPPAVELRHVVKEYVDARGATVRAVDDVSLTVEEGEFFALVGPSGCGKTTTLRAIAGFEDLTAGEVLLAGEAMAGVPPHHRPVNTVFQDYALFPHMSVLQNVSFGLRMAGVGRRAARERAQEALALVHLPGVSERRPRALSGGQRQRVALARALVNRPAVLLLDEPLGALDLKLRKAMQDELKRLQNHVGITFVYVTHDQEEALAMADRIAVMAGGRVLQVGTPDDVYERPTSRFVADFIGETNFLPGTLERLWDGRGVVALGDARRVEAAVRDPLAREGGPVSLAVRPEKIELVPLDADTADVRAAAGVWSELDGVVVSTRYLGTDTRYVVALASGDELVARAQNRDVGYGGALAPGSRVRARWRAEHAGVVT
jgi:spermidine/putrescine transport system ATP-binding protein